jgi:tetratricopeptide (TPR) repeat protein
MDRLRYSEQARRMALLGKWDEAVSNYSLAIAGDPSDVATYEGRAKAHYMLGEHEKAVEDYARAIEAQETPRLYLKRGHVLLQLSRFAEADQDYHRAISLGASSATAYEGMGDAHRLQGELDEAIRSYTVAVGPNDDGWWATYYFRGVSYFRLRQFQQALEDFQRVIVLQPHNGHAYFARGVIRWLGGQCSAALIDFQAFVALSDGEEALALRAQSYIEQLEAMVRCEPQTDAPLLLSSRGMAWLRAPWE